MVTCRGAVSLMDPALGPKSMARHALVVKSQCGLQITAIQAIRASGRQMILT